MDANQQLPQHNQQLLLIDSIGSQSTRISIMDEEQEEEEDTLEILEKGLEEWSSIQDVNTEGKSSDFFSFRQNSGLIEENRIFKEEEKRMVVEKMPQIKEKQRRFAAKKEEERQKLSEKLKKIRAQKEEEKQKFVEKMQQIEQEQRKFVENLQQIEQEQRKFAQIKEKEKRRFGNNMKQEKQLPLKQKKRTSIFRQNKKYLRHKMKMAQPFLNNSQVNEETSNKSNECLILRENISERRKKTQKLQKELKFERKFYGKFFKNKEIPFDIQERQKVWKNMKSEITKNELEIKNAEDELEEVEKHEKMRRKENK